MAHSPELPEKYVCVECQVVHAGTVSRSDDGHHYEAPDQCGCCGGTELISQERWPSHGR